MARHHHRALLLAGALLWGCASSDVPEEELAPLVDALSTHGKPPVEYVISKFENHDLVILGEYQLVKRDVQFVIELIPHLHRAGVRVLALEYATAEDQLALDSLVTDLQYAGPRALQVQRRYAGGTWPYREYLDIYQAAWDVNRKREAGTEPFRIVAISPAIDFEAINYGDEDQKRLASRLLAGTEPYMAAATRRLSTELGEKALVYCAMRRAFTDHHPPVLVDGKVVRPANRMGNLLAAELGDRVCTIALHAPWPGGGADDLVSPCGGAIDQAVAAHGDSVGFDVAGSPFADLVERRSIYAAGDDDGVPLARLVDGYVAHAPISELEGVTLISGWIGGEQAFARARRSFPDRKQAESFEDIRDVTAAFQRDAALPVRFERVR